MNVTGAVRVCGSWSYIVSVAGATGSTTASYGYLFSGLYRILKLFSQILTGIDLPCEVQIGKRFRIEHFRDIIVSGDAQFGDDVVLRNGVTVGLRNTGVRGAPRIGSRVDIGAGAKILGLITVGDDVAIGANAVVLRDVPPNSLAVGVPARIIPRESSSTIAANSDAKP